MAVVERLLGRAIESDCRGVLVRSGERPGVITDVAEALAARFPERADAAVALIGDAAEDAFVDLAIEVSRAAMRKGLLPHTNLGVLSRRSLARLKPWNVSIGLMLETLREDITAHSGAYRQVPAR